MKVILYMAMSVNGYIAKRNDETPWSKEEWKSFSSFVKKTGNLVIGRRTYELMKEDGFKNFGNPLVIVVTHRKIRDVLAAKSPKDAITILKRKGFKTVLVAGGSRLNSSFIKPELIDELYIDVEPLILGKGIPFFQGENFEKKLNLIDISKLSKNTIQLHYSVLNKSH